MALTRKNLDLSFGVHLVMGFLPVPTTYISVSGSYDTFINNLAPSRLLDYSFCPFGPCIAIQSSVNTIDQLLNKHQLFQFNLPLPGLFAFTITSSINTDVN